MNPYDVFLIAQPFASPFDVLLTIEGGGSVIVNKILQLIALYSMTGD